MDRLPHWTVALACSVAFGAWGCAEAQTARSGGNASAQLLQEMQQIASERTALQGENEKLKSQLADLKKDRDALKAAQQGIAHRAEAAAAALASSSAQREATEQELTQTKAKMQELIARFRETIQKLREVETDDTSVKQTLAGREHELSVCRDHNQALYRLNAEVLTRLEKEGVFTRIAEAEPFTKLKRVQLENYVDAARSKADEALIPPQTASPPAKTVVAPNATPPPETH